MRRKDPFPGHPTLRRCLDCALGSGQAQPRVLCGLSLWAGLGGRTCAESEEGQQERGPGHGGRAPSSASEPAAGLGLLGSLILRRKASCKSPSCPSWPGDRPAADWRAAGSQQESPGACLPGLCPGARTLSGLSEKACPFPGNSRQSSACAWGSHRRPLWG